MAGVALVIRDVISAVRGVLQRICTNQRLVVDDLEKLRAAVQSGGVELVNEIRDDISAGSPNYRATITELVADHATNKTAVDALVDKLNFLLTQSQKDQVLHGIGVTTGATMAVDANPENTEMGNAIEVMFQGMKYAHAATAEIDLSTLTINTDVISAGKWGVGWHFMNTASVVDVESPKTPQAYDSLIEALAEGWVNATNTLPPVSDEMCWGHCALLESVGGGFSWGPDSISAETSEEFKSYVGLPGIESVTAAFLITAASKAKFDYGAAVVHLGDQTRVSLTGKTDNVVAGTNVATTKSGAWLVYGLANDVEYTLQLGAAYADAATALAAVRDHNPNPYLPIIGYFIVDNQTGGNFIPGTTEFDATDVTTTFYKVGPGANFQEFGRGALNQPIAVTTSENADTLTNSSVPAALGAAADTGAVDAAGDLTAYNITIS